MSVVFVASDQLYSPTERVLTNDYGFEVVEYSNPITGVALYAGKPSPPVESDSPAVFGVDWWLPPGLPTPFVPPPPPQGTCCSLELPENNGPVPDTAVPEPSYTVILIVLLVALRIFNTFVRRSGSVAVQNRNFNAS